ncbi:MULTISPECIES: hypothetical protein [Burkholderia cepacia complex]|uniref:Uncharacterized protein n=1 Tax=Burkholderia vietnamiensis TaxID=60552 RepID=A0AAW7TA49_BURVI|nr:MULTISPECIES: hypothetical protein [Burkholderia cepacia complex]MBU9639677.1 hypothetical protein [Burkholderia multivorans]MDN7798360.1 hypothetical protein [Burkholderia vietnamiensis]ONN78852.1 hypothetical protein A8D63_34890 [Burkholderia cenocepacia]ONN79153.1 hypothetical protein A8D64_31150 [Burkholderia cenocepacia]ONN81836.1 hypothetical protein A8D62_30845 [Burkholderia cenocepacia]
MEIVVTKEVISVEATILGNIDNQIDAVKDFAEENGLQPPRFVVFKAQPLAIDYETGEAIESDAASETQKVVAHLQFTSQRQFKEFKNRFSTHSRRNKDYKALAAEAVKLRATGLSHSGIAETLGVCQQFVQKSLTLAAQAAKK